MRYLNSSIVLQRKFDTQPGSFAYIKGAREGSSGYLGQIEFGVGNSGDNAVTRMILKSDGSLLLGDADATRTILFENGTSNKAGIRYESTTDKMQFSHDGTTWTDIGSGGGGGAAEVEFRPDDFWFHATDTGVDTGKFSDIMATLDFDPDTNGSVLVSFRIPSNWDTDTDIDFKMVYSLSGVDNTKTVKITGAVWVTADGATDTEASPDATGSKDITSAAGNTGVLDFDGMGTIKVPNAQISSVDSMVTLKIKRDADDVGDTYTGTFQLVNVFAYQA